jgi:AbrB family looped-hinge helix DNA binding protein
MKATIDRAGRVVIPKSIRDELGLRGGQELDITIRDSRIEITPESKAVRLVERDGFLAAEIVGEKAPRLTAEGVRALVERLRR